jgi:hypothetical protein
LALIPDKSLIEKVEDDNEDRLSRGEEPLPIVDWLDSDSVLTLFDKHTPRLVFLHACQGAAPDLLATSLESFTNTARDLAYTKIPAVIAMQYKISNDAAQRFARKFYDEIRKGKHIDEAVVQARYLLGSDPTPGRQAWDERTFGTPVIYLRSEKPIIQPPPSEDEETEGEETENNGQPETIHRVPCPYPDCEGKVFPDRKRCLTCRRRLMLCPGCRYVMAQEIGLCDRCEYEVETSAKSAQVVPITAVHAAPAQSARPPSGYDPATPDDQQPRIS